NSQTDSPNHSWPRILPGKTIVFRKKGSKKFAAPSSKLYVFYFAVTEPITSPCVCEPLWSIVKSSTSSIFVKTIITVSDFSSSFKASKSTLASKVSFVTLSPSDTKTSQGRPSNSTVSIPICTNTSIPLSVFKPSACYVGKTETTSPLIGE